MERFRSGGGGNRKKKIFFFKTIFIFKKKVSKNAPLKSQGCKKSAILIKKKSSCFRIEKYNLAVFFITDFSFAALA
jgi:hypothetical protein